MLYATSFCGSSICSNNTCKLVAIFNSSTCINHVVVISISTLLSILYLLDLFLRISNKNVPARRPFSLFSPRINVLSIAMNGGLHLVYLGLGVYMLIMNFTKGGSTYYPPHQWLTALSQAIYMLVLSLVFTTRLKNPKAWSILSMLFSGFICSSSIIYILKSKKAVVHACLDILSLPSALLILVIALKQPRDEDTVIDENLYKSLYSDTDTISKESGSNVTPLSTAGFFSLMSFWWLNPLLRKGYLKPLEDKDIPELGAEDQAGTQYADFLDKLNNSQQKCKQSASPSTLWAIVSCYKRDTVVSGVFALLKILTISVCPLIVNAFIKVYLGQEAFKYECHVLALGLFFAKCLESLSQRQWFFRTRRVGVRVRSLLSAAIYKKQQRLSNLAKMTHSSGEIMNYVIVDAYRIGELPYWFHQTWTTSLQLCIALVILYNSVGLATISSMVTIIVTVACNAPLANLQHQFQIELMKAQDKRLKAMSESLANMKVLKLYSWERHFKKVIENLRQKEFNWIKAFQLRKGYNTLLFWSSPVLVSAATFLSCYLMRIPLDPSNVFTFVATVRLVQEPVRQIPDVISAVIQAKVAFARISNFLEAPELQSQSVRKTTAVAFEKAIVMELCSFSWDENLSSPNLRNVSLEVSMGEKVAICGEVGSGKSTVLAALLGEVSKTSGAMQVCGQIAYVSQSAWIQTGTVQENILFGSPMDKQRYQETLERCSLIKDLDMLPFGDQTQIGERGINLSGGQKQRVQLARALYRDADIYLLDDPFSAVDAQTASSLFNDYVMGGLADKTVLLVTHQVDFLPAFDTCLLMSNGEILHSGPFNKLIASCKEFQNLVHAHEETVGQQRLINIFSPNDGSTNTKTDEIRKIYGGTVTKLSAKKDNVQPSEGLSDQLIKKEERARGDTGLKPYMQYLGQNKGYLFFSLGALSHFVFVSGQILQNSWMAANLQNPNVSTLELILVYLGIGFGALIFLLFRSISVVVLGLETSKSLFFQLLNSLFHAPMRFYDSTPLGRILSRVSSDLSIVDLDVPFSFVWCASSGTNTYSILGVLAVLTWQVLFISVPMIVLAIQLQRYYLTSAKEMMRINGTTKSLLANHLSESIMGAVTIRAYQEEERFFSESVHLINKNASPFLHNFASTEWLILRLEMMSAAILASSALIMALVPPGTFTSAFVGMALSYGLSLNTSLVNSIQHQCKLANLIISFERLKQCMNIESEPPEVIEENRPAPDWPTVGTVQLQDLKIRYRPDTPLVLHGITCTFQGGQKVGVVGRTGSGKTTLISALFRLVEPTEGKIIVDGLDITEIGLHDLRSRFSIIPQDPTLFQGSVRYNLDPIGQFSDQQIWDVLDKCQLREAVDEDAQGLDSLVNEEGSNWSMGQRQLFCLGRALLRKSRILVLDEATASIDNATDAILQKTIRTEFVDCTVITVAHRIPTVMDCNMVLAISDGKLVEYDEPMKLINKEGSLFRELVKEYWSHSAS